MFKQIKKYEKVIQVIAGLSLFTLIALWLLSRADKKIKPLMEPEKVPANGGEEKEED